jgi:hypothetical protein
VSTNRRCLRASPVLDRAALIERSVGVRDRFLRWLRLRLDHWLGRDSLSWSRDPELRPGLKVIERRRVASPTGRRRLAWIPRFVVPVPRTVGQVSLALALSAYEHWLDHEDTSVLDLLDEAMSEPRNHLRAHRHLIRGVSKTEHAAHALRGNVVCITSHTRSQA